MVERWFFRLSLLPCLLALGVVVMGAYVRLSDAGLGCPDWPVCYGQLTWPRAESDIIAANAAFPQRPVEVEKAWKEQLHRFVAAALGLLVLTLALLANWQRPARRYQLIGAAAAAAGGIFAYVGGRIELAALLSVAAIGLPLAAAIAWRDDWRGRASAGLLGLVIFQALLGKWTVTLLVKPIIVTAHLLGGLAILALLWWLVLRQSGWLVAAGKSGLLQYRLTLAVLLIVLGQIALGGWTSTNYAALACTDFPTCNGAWWPAADFREAFVLWRGLGIDYEFGVLDNPARVAIQLTHRLGALVTLIAVLSLVTALIVGSGASAPARRLAATAGALVILQFALGVANVLLSLPLRGAVAHNGVAALLLLTMLSHDQARRPQPLGVRWQGRELKVGRAVAGSATGG